MLAISAMLLALNQLQHISDRPLWFAAAALACVLATVGFVVQERRTQRPIIDLRFFRDFDFSLLNAGHAALSLAGFSVLLLVPFYLSRFGGLTRVRDRPAAGLLARRHRVGGATRRSARGARSAAAARADRRGAAWRSGRC